MKGEFSKVNFGLFGLKGQHLKWLTQDRYDNNSIYARAVNLGQGAQFFFFDGRSIFSNAETNWGPHEGDVEPDLKSQCPKLAVYSPCGVTLSHILSQAVRMFAAVCDCLAQCEAKPPGSDLDCVGSDACKNGDLF